MTTPKIIFENSHFLAIDKPALWLSVPAREKSDPRPVAIQFLREFTQHNQLLPCHRLDYETSGILLIAKTTEAHRSANKWFEDHTIQKTYFALSEGDPTRAEEFRETQTWKTQIVRGKKRSFTAPHGKPSITIVKFLGLNKNAQLQWQLEPKTGRPHQLRFELSRHNFPIVGDKLYGAKTKSENGGIELRAMKLNFSNCEGHAKFELPVEFEIAT